MRLKTMILRLMKRIDAIILEWLFPEIDDDER